MTSRRLIRVLAVPTLASLTMIGGCSSDPSDVSFDAITSDLTPHLTGLTEQDVDIQRNMAVITNQNLRMMYGDLGRAMLWDAPSSLSPYDVINTSGQPTQ
ncbi:MAG: hypothetical protein VX672_08015 [Planctomycetota bacterium]|nr:hypothetical protein [Planctomycetota bacterium]